MKIAMIGQKHIGLCEGGVERVVEEISTRMVKLGHDVTCYDRKGKHKLDKNKKIIQQHEYNGVKIIEVFTIDKKGLAALTSSFFGTIKILFSNNEIVHYHAEGPCAMLWLIKWFSKKKIIVTIHGLDWQRAKWKNGFASKYIKFGEIIAAKYADEIIVLSKNVQKYFKNEYNRNTNFIPNGVTKPITRYIYLIKKKYGLNKNDYILFLGRIVPEKGVHYLINAYNQIKTDKKLVIAGAPSDTEDYYNELLQMSKSNNKIIFTGFVYGEELEELYSNSYIYILPSDLEGMPLSLLEAMSYGNCCLTSDISECAEVIEDKGLTFEKSNIEDLKKKLQILLDDEQLLKKYKKESQSYILNKFNWDEIAEKTIELYKVKE